MFKWEILLNVIAVSYDYRYKIITVKMVVDRGKCQMIGDWKWEEKEAILYFKFAYSR